MGLIKTLGRYAWRKYVTDGVFSSGYNKPDQIDIFPFVDVIDSTVTALSGGGELQGGWDASAGAFPGFGAATTGQSWIATTAGTVGGVAFRVGDRVIAVIDNASTATYAGNWQRLPASVDPIVPAEATGGTANAIEATTSDAITGDASQAISILWAANNTGSATVRFNGAGPTYPIKTRSGANVQTGYLVAGSRDLGQIVGGNFQLLSDVATASDRAAAEAAADEAAGYAAGLNLPAVTVSDAGKALVVKSDGSGFETGDLELPARDASADKRKIVQVDPAGSGAFTLLARRKILLIAISQSNFANTSATAWKKPVPDNLFVWNGGNWNGDATPPLGTAFVHPNGSTVQIPVMYAAEVARAHPDADIYLVIIARGGTAVNSFVGMDYLWDSATSGDPGTGSIGFNNATAASATQVRYSETDGDGYTRYLGTLALVMSDYYPAIIEKIGDEANTWVKFLGPDDLGTYTDNGAWRSQTIAYDSSANWPPADNTPVRVWKTWPRMDQVLIANVEAAFTALGMTGDDRAFSKVLIWPTEGDLNTPVAYYGRDFDALADILYDNGYAVEATPFLFTLPYPYATGISGARQTWWNVIRKIVRNRDVSRKLVGLTSSGQENWDSPNNYVHVAGAGMEAIGSFMYESELRGGELPSPLDSDQYIPTLTGVANIDTVTPVQCNYMRVGNMVDVNGLCIVDATAGSGTDTTFRISLPIPSDITFAFDLNGIGIWQDTTNSIIPAVITGDTTNNCATLTYKSNYTASKNLYFQFKYKIIDA